MVTYDMCMVAANEWASFQEERGIHEEDIVPKRGDWEFFPRETVVSAQGSIEECVIIVKPSRQELWERATSIIRNTRESTNPLMKKGLSQLNPEDI